eukprot:Clim_evm37s203 gene=Clim_evmTU37s203
MDFFGDMPDLTSELTEEELMAVGVHMSYMALLTMATMIVYQGSQWSLAPPKDGEEAPETVGVQDAVMFPVIASCVLFGLYMLFHIFGKEYINMLLTSYFFIIGIVAIANMLGKIAGAFMDTSTLSSFELKMSMIGLDTKINTAEIFGALIGAVLGGLFVTTKHWIVNNIFGISFSLNGVAMLSLGSYGIGCTMLGGLFFYDVFWVFGTDVMVTVAKSFDAPIKLLWPKDILINGPLDAKQFAMLGLGDIVLPGIFIALLLRFDRHRSKVAKHDDEFKRPYFHTTTLGYVVGLALTMVIMHTFEAAQPALLYLVPSCIGFSFTCAIVLGEVNLLLEYDDEKSAEKYAGKGKRVKKSSKASSTPERKTRTTRGKKKVDDEDDDSPHRPVTRNADGTRRRK